MDALLKDRILAGEVRAVARAASLIENQTATGHQLVDQLFPHTGRAITIGITGPPGAGKSTLVNEMTKLLRQQGKTVGIIAVDPSSPYSNGAILGDRIRMLEHHADEGVFIRSMSSRGRMGGVAQSTLDLILLLDAAGRDIVIIETVGVGQDEVDIVKLADLTVVVLVPGLGDDVQAIKAGIIEVADVFAINKADLPGAENLEQYLRQMQSFGGAHQKEAPIRRVVATRGEGIAGLLTVIFSLKQQTSIANVWTYRLAELVRDRVMAAISGNDLEWHANAIAQKTQTPYTAVEALVAQCKSTI